MGNSRTVKKRVKKTPVRRKKRAPSVQARALNSQTMQIPLETIFGNQNHHSTACLDVICPDMESFRIYLSEKPIVIGRDTNCDICLPLTNVSREHAQVVFDGAEHAIEDLDSTNGTLVNNVSVSRCTLRDNDLIRIGEASIMFVRQRRG